MTDRPSDGDPAEAKRGVGQARVGEAVPGSGGGPVPGSSGDVTPPQTGPVDPSDAAG